MKTKPLLSLAFAAIAITTIALSLHAKDKPSKGLIVHEWGTFTSLQGGDGKLIPWKPLKTSQLPNFVYDWSKPDLGLSPSSMFLLSGKGSIISLQRMETPVIYFYSDEKQPQPVDISVKFPQGFITEWYPCASQVGPSVALSNRIPASAQSKESMIRWSDLHFHPASQANIQSQLPNDTSGSHYFAARDTDANYVRWTRSPEASYAQFEKFLFYRGVGNFDTPLRVTMQTDDEVNVTCNAWTTLSHVFVLAMKDKAGRFVYIEHLGPGETKTVAINSQTRLLPPAILTEQITKKMSRALVQEGLYPREATAMVNTWKDSWFAEDGLRVLYVLPRPWTDQILPMEVKPAPKQLVRVMVGRAEIFSPSLERFLAQNLDKAKGGDTTAANEARKTLRNLGRFAEPAFYRALASAKPQLAEQGKLMALLNDANKSN